MWSALMFARSQRRLSCLMSAAGLYCDATINGTGPMPPSLAGGRGRVVGIANAESTAAGATLAATDLNGKAPSYARPIAMNVCCHS